MFVQECLLRNVGEAKMYVMLELTKRGYSPMYVNYTHLKEGACHNTISI